MLVAISKSLQLVNAEWRGQFPCVSTCDADHCKHGDNGDDDADLGDGDHDGDHDGDDDSIDEFCIWEGDVYAVFP